MYVKYRKPSKWCIEEISLYFPEGHREIENAWKDVEIKFSYVPKKYVDISPRATGSHMNFIETGWKCLEMLEKCMEKI